MSIYPHEQLLHTLSALLIELHTLQFVAQSDEQGNSPDLEAIRSGLGNLQTLACESLALVRSSLEDIPLPELDGVTLVEALSQLVEENAERLGLASRLSFSGVDEQQRPLGRTLAVAIERLLYLLAREMLYQVEQHRDARRLRLTLHYRPEDVQMSLEDDGFLRQQEVEASSDLSQRDVPSPLFALLSAGEDLALSPVMRDLRSRLEEFGGSLEITTLEERGVRIRTTVPYGVPAALADSQTPDSSFLPAQDSLSASRSTSVAAAAVPVEQVTILIVDALAMTRAGLHRLLDVYPGLSVIGEASDGMQAVSETLELGPQVVLMDTQLPNGQSLEALRQIKQLNLDSKVLLLATQDREEYLYETLRAGADGYILKDMPPDGLAEAVRAVARGEVLVQPQLAGRLLSRFGRQGRGARYDTLTVRELEVLRLLARGMRNKEIAARLIVSERTVNFHLANIYQKLSVSGRTEALSKALAQGLITP